MSKNSGSSSSVPSCQASCRKLMIEELLECPVCFDFAISPIYSCKNGHILCACCFEKLNICGFCQEEYAPSGLAERLAAQHHDIKISCKNFEPGCRLTFESAKLYAHLPDCQYRPIKCMEDSGGVCGRRVFDLKDLCAHLIKQHRGTFVKLYGNTDSDRSNGSEAQPPEMRTTIEYKWTLDHIGSLTIPGEPKKLPVSYFEYDGNVFLLHRGVDEGLFMWITVLGALNEADTFKYTCKITICSSDPHPNDIEPSFVIPVLPIHGNYDFKSVLESGSCAFLDPRILKKLLSKTLDQCTEYLLYGWNLGIEIKLR